MGIETCIILPATVILIVISTYLYLKVKKVYSTGLKVLRETVVELDAKDPYFNGHIKNVENLSMQIADELKFSKRKEK